MNAVDFLPQATRLVTNLRRACKYLNTHDQMEAIQHYLGASRAMLEKDTDTPRFYRTCAAVAAEQSDMVLAEEITRIAEMTEGTFALFK